MTAAHLAHIVHLLQRLREHGPQLSAVGVVIDRHLADQGLSAEDAIRAELQRQAAAQVSVANAITSLRLCSALDWREYFEAVSLVDRTLRLDPAGAYRRMDFLSRDRLRQAVEAIAPAGGDAQVRVAAAAVEQARRAESAGSVNDRAAHVGYHLIDRGRPALETAVGVKPGVTERGRRLLHRHATGLYLGTIAAVTAALIAGGVAYGRHASARAGILVSVALFLTIPASEIAIALLQRLVVLLVAPKRLPRLDLQDGVPASARTMVVLPTMLTSVAGVEALVEHVEVLALANMDPNIHFAILSDFTDARAGQVPGDEAIIAAARAGIEALN